MGSSGLLERLVLEREHLSPQLQRAAGYLLDHQDEAAFRSMRQVAAKAHVQPATMVRLAQRLGCRGYEDLREAFRNRVRHASEGYRNRAARLQRHRGRGALTYLATEMILADQANLGTTLERVTPDQITAVAKEMAQARRLYFVGLRSLYPAAFYLHYACRMFRDNTVLLDGRGGTFTDDMRGVNERDLMLVFSLRPYTTGSVQAARYAAVRGATIVAVTDSSVSPLARMSTHTLRVAAESPALFNSVVPAMAIAQVLVALLLAQGGRRALLAVAESEEQLSRMEAYWPEQDRIAVPGAVR